MSQTQITILLLLLPLLAFVVNGLWGKALQKLSGIFSTGIMLIVLALALVTAGDYFLHTGKVEGVFIAKQLFSYNWLEFSPGMSITMGIVIDPISVMMLVVITLISSMVHVYSLGYMKGEERYSTYFAYLDMFTFSMLGLVVSVNIFQMYFFWELVGVSSFLLIGYYFQKPSAVAAAKKAFIVTRFADLGFLIGILTLGYYAHSFEFTDIISRLSHRASSEWNAAAQASFLGISAISWGLILVFIGGAGKSAMFPLHIWLPDAMEGPTPVSALIHAATMVVAGVYLVARLFAVYVYGSPHVLECIGYVGAFSAVLAAIIACTQTDIKRVLAYSTMSQIGFMMFALGVSKYGGENGLGFMASMFHLFTHAMFKALLFLGAGAVIHYVHSNDMNDMGGLAKKMPVTHITFLIACLAIAGVPPLAGFFSKEEILLAAYQHNRGIYWLALITSGLTAFYMFRLYFMIFWNKPYNGHTHHHESPLIMKLPLLLLAAGAVLAGFIPFGHFVSSDGKVLHTSVHVDFSILPVGLGIAGILLVFMLYRKESTIPSRISQSSGMLYTFISRKFYLDELYLFITKKIIFNLIARPVAWIDRNVVDGLVNVTGNMTVAISAAIKNVQSGKVQQYAFWFLAGVISIAAIIIYYQTAHV